MKVLPLAALLISLCSSRAVPQGTGQQFAAPMTWPEVRVVLESVSASDDQIAQVLALHDVYLAQMDIIRTEDIDPLLDKTGGWGLGNTSDADGTRLLLARARRIREDIATADGSLFASMHPILGPSQQPGLDRALDRRTRDRFRARRGQFGSSLGIGEAIEPRDHIAWSDLDAATATQARSVLEPWEIQLTDLLSRYDVARDRGLLTFTDSLADAHRLEEDLDSQRDDEPEFSQERFEKLSAAIEAAYKAQRDALASTRRPLRNHIERGLSDLAAILPPRPGLDLVRTCLHRHVGRDAVGRTADSIRPLLDDSGLVTLDEIVSAWNADATALCLEQLQAQWAFEDDQERAIILLSSGNDDRKLPEDPLGELRTRWTARHQQTLDDIAALGPAESGVTHANVGTGHEVDHGNAVTTSSAVFIIGGAPDDGDAPGSGGVFVTGSIDTEGMNMMFPGSGGPPPLPANVVDRLTRDLSLDDDGRRRLEELLDVHRAGVQDLKAAQPDMAELMQQAMTGGEVDQQAIVAMLMKPSDPNETADLDEAFFDGATSLTADRAPVEPHRLHRRRVRQHSGGGMLGRSLAIMDVPDDRWKADLLEAVETANLTEKDRRAAMASLADWHEPATTGQMEIAEINAELDEIMRTMMQVGSGGDAASAKVSIDGERARNMARIQTTLNKRKRAQAELNQAAADAVRATLDDPLRFRREWLSQAFPQLVVEDDFLPVYSRALDAPDLTIDQRASIAMLRAEHDTRWWATTDEMIASLADVEAPDPVDSSERFETHNRAMQDLDRMRFSRREDAIKGLEALRGMLTETQRASLEGLPDPPEPRHREFGF